MHYLNLVFTSLLMLMAGNRRAIRFQYVGRNCYAAADRANGWPLYAG
jgi:hypothetical protein